MNTKEYLESDLIKEDFFETSLPYLREANLENLRFINSSFKYNHKHGHWIYVSPYIPDLNGGRIDVAVLTKEEYRNRVLKEIS